MKSSRIYVIVRRRTTMLSYRIAADSKAEALRFAAEVPGRIVDTKTTKGTIVQVVE